MQTDARTHPRTHTTHIHTHTHTHTEHARKQLWNTTRFCIHPPPCYRSPLCYRLAKFRVLDAAIQWVISTGAVLGSLGSLLVMESVSTGSSPKGPFGEIQSWRGGRWNGLQMETWRSALGRTDNYDLAPGGLCFQTFAVLITQSDSIFQSMDWWSCPIRAHLVFCVCVCVFLIGILSKLSRICIIYVEIEISTALHAEEHYFIP